MMFAHDALKCGAADSGVAEKRYAPRVAICRVVQRRHMFYVQDSYG